MGDEYMEIVQTNNYELIAELNRTVHDLHVNYYPEYFTEYNYEDIKEYFKGVIDKKEYIFLLIKENDNPVGYVWIEMRDYPENAFKKQYRSVYVHQISVSEDCRGKGYGSHLMDEVCKIAKVNGINKIELDYWLKNESAKGFYEKKEFVKSREFVYLEL